MKLLRVQLDDQTLFHRSRDVITRRKVPNPGLVRGRVKFEPLRNLATLHRFEGAGDTRNALALVIDCDLIALLHEVRRNVNLAAVHTEVTVTNELASFIAGIREARAIDHVVHTKLEHREEVVAGNALATLGFLEQAAELLL